MILPSEELLREIMKIGEDSIIDDLEVYKNNILYAVDGQYADDINIYELMHSMKVLALKKGYWIDSNLGFVSIGFLGVQEAKKKFNFYYLKLNETELVTKACEWILEHKI